MNLTVEESRNAVYVGFYAIELVLPIILYCVLRGCFPNASRGAHEKISVVVVWFLVTAYMIWALPIRIAYHRLIDDPNSPTYGMWDGTGENSFILVFGWVLPTFSLLVFAGCLSLIRFIRKRSMMRGR